MIIKKLYLKNFRNIRSADFLFSDKTNIISGNNAQGKTNLMEAMVCAVEKSFRTNKAAEMLPQSGKSSCDIKLEFITDKYREKNNILNCSINQRGIRRTINDISYKEALQLYPQLKTIVFIPEDLYVVKGNPEARRELVDETADMMNKIHRNMTNVYYKALKQKNTFLSSLRDESISKSQKMQLAVWNEELAKAGVNVMCGRLKYFLTLCKYTCDYYEELNNNNECLKAEYYSSVMDGTEFDISDTELILNTYIDKLERYSDKELILRHTLVGVHRDDLSFYINGKPAREFASQGQIRSIAVALRLAQAKMFGEKWEEPPVIVLDDVLSELDGYRREFILKHIVDSQVFITGCNDTDFGNISGSKIWKAHNGEFDHIETKNEHNDFVC